MMNTKILRFIGYHMGYSDYPSFEDALREVSVEKRKSSHWIWYVVPYDRPSKTHGDAFVLRTRRDIASFLENDYLRGNYTSIMGSIADILEPLATPQEFHRFASEVDLKKMYLSARMFAPYVSIVRSYDDVREVCGRVTTALERYVQAKTNHDGMVGRQTVLLRSICADIRAQLHKKPVAP